MQRLLCLLLVGFLMTVPAAIAEPPIHTYCVTQDLRGTKDVQTGWQKFWSGTLKTGKFILRLTVNGLEVTGSIAQLLQYTRGH